MENDKICLLSLFRYAGTILNVVSNIKYLAFGFSGMGLTMNCQAEYSPP